MIFLYWSDFPTPARLDLISLVDDLQRKVMVTHAIQFCFLLATNNGRLKTCAFIGVTTFDIYITRLLVEQVLCFAPWIYIWMYI